MIIAIGVAEYYVAYADGVNTNLSVDCSPSESEHVRELSIETNCPGHGTRRIV